MGLKAPGILSFTLSVVIVVAVLIVKFFGADIPLLKGNEFAAVLLAYVVLVAGCILRI